MKLIFISYPAAEQKKPVFFIKPDTALLRNNQPFYYPDYSKDIRATLTLVIRINRLGRSISRQFAGRYFDAVNMGIDFTAYDLLATCLAEKAPVDCAKSFDFAAPVGTEFLPVTKNITDYSLQLFHNNCEITTVQPLLPYLPEEIIAHVSQFITLKIGDYIYLSTPLITPTLQINDTLTALLDKRELLHIAIK